MGTPPGLYLFSKETTFATSFLLPWAITPVQKGINSFFSKNNLFSLTLLHSDQPKLYGVQALLRAIGLKAEPYWERRHNENGGVASLKVHPYTMKWNNFTIWIPWTKVTDGKFEKSVTCWAITQWFNCMGDTMYQENIAVVLLAQPLSNQDSPCYHGTYISKGISASKSDT